VYFSWFERAAVVVLPYVSKKYSSSTSGIFVEAICLGVPVLCPANSWMSDVVEDALRAHGRRIGEVFASLDEIPSLVARMAGDLARYRADVREYSAIWHARHNPRQWLRTLLASAR
jgi:glycosyltransferase involved in cell wall biosynthesis